MSGVIGKKIIEKQKKFLKPKEKKRKKSRKKSRKKIILNKNCVKRSNLSLRPHQKKVVKYLDNHDGLLVIHGTGTGKTLTSVTASQCFLDNNPNSKVVVVSPASLVHNFKKEMLKYKNINHSDRYEFYSYDKFLRNMYDNGFKDKYKGKYIEDYRNLKYFKPINLKGNMIIIDEAHNIRNFKTKKSIAVVLASYSASKRIVLSATPIVNNLSDLTAIINIVNGKKIVGTRKEFLQNEVKSYIKNITIKKPNISKETKKTIEKYLKNKIDIVDLNLTSKDFPKKFEHTIKVNMTEDFYLDYNRLLQKEEINSILINNAKAFYNGYRKLVNSVGIKKGENYYSMKIKKILPIIKKNKSIIYTNWLEFGINPLSEALNKNNIKFGIISGSVSQKERIEIVKDFNNNKINSLLITKAGGEGLDLKEVRNVIVIDPPWNPAGLEQIIGRAIRYKSHEKLPKKDRNVNVYYMELELPLNIKKMYKKDSFITKTGDTILYDIIKRKIKMLKMIDSILTGLQIS